MNELLINKLKTARNEKGLKQQDVADILGLKANTISNWEKGRTEPDIDTFVKLCEIYEIDCSSILADVYAFKRIKSDISLPEYEHIKKYRTLDTHGKEVIDFLLNKEAQRMAALEEQNKKPESGTQSNKIRLFTYYNKMASAGKGEYLFDDMIESKLPVYESEESMKADFLIGVNGDSMKPKYMDGDIVFVQQQEIINIGDIGIFIINNESVIKQAGEDRLISLNPEYDDIIIHDSDDFKCVGKVIGKAKLAQK